MEKIILYLLVGIIVGFWFGWRAGHITVANECEKLGAFYVDGVVYKCTVINKKNSSDHHDSSRN